MSSCCPETPAPQNHESCAPKGGVDGLLYSALAVILVALAVHLTGLHVPVLSDFAHAVAAMMKAMWWGIAVGIVAVGLMNKVPREYFNALLGRGDSIGGLLRAMLAGLLLDLCSHGILMVGAKMYERGASLPQVITFLIASPWNSFTLTFILIGLIGLTWTLVFIAGSAAVALLTGYIYLLLTRRGVLPANPNAMDTPDGFKIVDDARARLRNFRLNGAFIKDVAWSGLIESRMVLRWLFLGVVLASLIHAFVPTDTLTAYFGPTLLGLFLTLAATTLIEVCSEGSTPIGAELVTRAGAPGNGFAFLMAGVATDYTEIMIIREFTKSWKAALFLPLVSVPQVLILGYIMNNL